MEDPQSNSEETDNSSNKDIPTYFLINITTFILTAK